MANKAKLTDKYIRGLSPQSTRLRVWDTENPYLILDVLPTGKKVFRVYYRRKGKPAYSTIDSYGAITLKEARDEALKVRSMTRSGFCPVNERRLARAKDEADRKELENQRVLILGNFIEQVYEPDANRRGKKSLAATIRYLKTSFNWLQDKHINQITIKEIEDWQVRELKRGLLPESINRALTVLRAVLNMAVEKEYITTHPLKRLKDLPVYGSNRTRHLSPDEEIRLRNALSERNQIRREKFISKREMRDNQIYADHVEPLILLTLNTGMRKSEVFQLRWDNINMDSQIITVAAETAKSSKERHINMNEESKRVLENCSKHSTRSGLVFVNRRNGKPLDPNSIRRIWTRVLKEAGIENFRFHDLRHTFASNLVMRGAPLYMVQTLLGHSTLMMTMKYAHLSPESTAQVVALLDKEQ